MVDRYLRSSKDLILDAVSKRLPRISPTAVTFTAFAVGLVACVATWQSYYLWGLGFWLANRILDGLDGSLARHYAKQTDLGGYLDIMLDFVIYALLPLSLVLSQPSQVGFIALALLLISFYINAGSWMYLSAILEKRHQLHASLTPSLTSVAMPRGLVEGAETIVFYCLFLLFPQQLVWVFALMAVLVVMTAVQRVIWAVHTL
ncbi:MAG: CDP-alcohol phosphatidyltransferase family protein [Deinococcota bacterium]